MKSKGIYFVLDEQTMEVLEKLAKDKFKGNKTKCIQELVLNNNTPNLIEQEYNKLYVTFRESYEKIVNEVNVYKKTNAQNKTGLETIIKEFQTTTKELLEELIKLKPSKL